MFESRAFKRKLNMDNEERAIILVEVLTNVCGKFPVAKYFIDSNIIEISRWKNTEVNQV